jgi:integrase
MASIRRAGSSFKVRWNVYEDGQRRENTRNFATMALAREYCAKMELLEQRGVSNVSITLGAYLDEWIVEKQVEANTLAGYRRWIDHVKRHHIATLALRRLTPRDCERLYNALLDRLSPQSVRHVHALLQNALNDAVRHRLIDDNPAAHAKPPRGQSPRRGVPSPEQVEALLDDLAANNPDLVDLALLIIATGMRRSESIGLCWSDISWEEGRVSIRQVVIEYGGRWSIRPGTKSAAGSRTIGISGPVIDALRRQQAKVAALRLMIGRHWRDHDLVFPTPEGGPRAPASVTKAFTRAARRAGWPAHSSPVHSLRHAAASHAHAKGIDIAAISRRLGHSSVAVTARIYLSSDAEQDRAASEAMTAIAGRRGVKKAT